MAKGTGLRKRSQIAKANRTMFIWVASMSALVMISLVVSYHLILTIGFNARVTNERTQTISNLKKSNDNVKELKSQILALDANENLIAVKANSEDQAIQVVLDALPSTSNPLSFGASLQTILLVGPAGINVKSILVESGGEAAQENEQSSDDTQSQDDVGSGSNTDSANTVGQINFTFVVEGPEVSLQEVIQRLEKSIRTAYVDSFSVQRQGDVNEMSVNGHVFYQLEKTADLEKKVVK